MRKRTTVSPILSCQRCLGTLLKLTCKRHVSARTYNDRGITYTALTVNLKLNRQYITDEFLLFLITYLRYLQCNMAARTGMYSLLTWQRTSIMKILSHPGNKNKSTGNF